MHISNAHNLSQPSKTATVGTFGVRVSLPEGDPFAHLLDEGWHQTHWFLTARDRDDAMADMSRLHEYSRKGDRPALVFETIERDDTDL
jgi:hypothetical protein